MRVLKPQVVLLVGLLAIRTYLGRVAALTEVVGTTTIRDGVRYLPLPHPSGVSRWLNDPAHRALVDRALTQLSTWREQYGLDRPGRYARAVLSDGR